MLTNRLLLQEPRGRSARARAIRGVHRQLQDLVVAAARYSDVCHLALQERVEGRE
jgi:hypothetical protein